jgi:hypothetical protein
VRFIRLVSRPVCSAPFAWLLGLLRIRRSRKGRNSEMIRLVVATIALIAVIGSVAFAQDPTPKVQVFGGYSYVHVDNGGLTGADLDFALRDVNLPFGTASNFTDWNAEGQYNSTFGSGSRRTTAAMCRVASSAWTVAGFRNCCGKFTQRWGPGRRVTRAKYSARSCSGSAAAALHAAGARGIHRDSA